MPSITINGAIETQKIDSAATSGLSGVYNSLAYRVHEIEKHFHGYEKWFGSAAIPAGETHNADLINGASSVFTLTSGNSDWGAWLQLLGSSDTPAVTSKKYFDPHRIEVRTTSSTAPYFIQLVSGESAGLAANIAAGLYTIFPYTAASMANDSGPAEMMFPRIAAGTKLWARTLCIGENAKTITFYIGIHEYEG